jgi:hypothetical protein
MSSPLLNPGPYQLFPVAIAACGTGIASKRASVPVDKACMPHNSPKDNTGECVPDHVRSVVGLSTFDQFGSCKWHV